MQITPLDIRKQPFRRTFRGFDPDAVNSFLEMVAGEFETLIRQSNEASGRLKNLEEKLDGYVRIERTLNDTLVTAQRVADEQRANAKKEAELIIKQAAVRASGEEQESRLRIVKVENDLRDLRIQRDAFIGRLRAVMAAQLKTLDAISEDLHDSIDGKNVGPELIIAEVDAPAAIAETPQPSA